MSLPAQEPIASVFRQSQSMHRFETPPDAALTAVANKENSPCPLFDTLRVRCVPPLTILVPICVPRTCMPSTQNGLEGMWVPGRGLLRHVALGGFADSLFEGCWVGPEAFLEFGGVNMEWSVPLVQHLFEFLEVGIEEGHDVQ